MDRSGLESRLQRLDAEVEEIRGPTQRLAEAERERILADARASAERVRRDAAAAVEQAVDGGLESVGLGLPARVPGAKGQRPGEQGSRKEAAGLEATGRVVRQLGGQGRALASPGCGGFVENSEGGGHRW